MHFVIILCWISVVYANQSINLTKCQENAHHNNCEPFSFRRISQNFTTATNNSIEAKNIKTVTSIKSHGVIENQLAFKQSPIQEDGNF